MIENLIILAISIFIVVVSAMALNAIQKRNDEVWGWREDLAVLIVGLVLVLAFGLAIYELSLFLGQFIVTEPRL